MPGSESTCSTELQRAISRFHESPPDHWVGGEGDQLGSHCTEIGGDLTGRSPRPEVGAGHGRLARIGPGRLALIDDVRPGYNDEQSHEPHHVGPQRNRAPYPRMGTVGRRTSARVSRTHGCPHSGASAPETPLRHTTCMYYQSYILNYIEYTR